MNEKLGIAITISLIGIVMFFIICGITTEIKLRNLAEEVCEAKGFLFELNSFNNNIIGGNGFYPFSPLKLKGVRCINLDEGKEIIVKGS